jgi:hypothetical protein
VREVREFREASTRAATRDLAQTPSQFAFVSHPDAPYLLVPLHSSELRRFIPMAMVPADVIASNACSQVHSGDPYVFGVLQSTMHMAWLRTVCGRIKSDFRYSNEIVYNNFPWPAAPTGPQVEAVRQAAQAVVAARAAHPGATLADLYDDDVMPVDLQQAHTVLDRAVDACYRRAPFDSELTRVTFLFGLYSALKQAVQASLVTAPRSRRSRVRR